MADAPPEFPASSTTAELEQGERFTPRFDGDGLIPAIVTDDTTGEVLMFAWMNATALARTLETRIAHFWSRSRKKIWMKGEESGNVLNITRMTTDCDQDVVWLQAKITGAGVACHTGARSCFYREILTDSAADPHQARLKRRD
ncbi:MAG: phosphoribosyl-AMP cyclohydrolase [Hyphomicrobiaceae bacterium]|nr:phosphoribosyl-AMP cyclohydrolase [Hyphomicrobiaceae bacterium]